MNTGAAPRVLLAVACLLGLVGALGVLTGATGTDRTDEPFPAAVPAVAAPEDLPDERGVPATVLAAEAGVVTTYAAGAPSERMPAVRDAQERAESAGRGVWGPECARRASAPRAPGEAPLRGPGPVRGGGVRRQLGDEEVGRDV